MEFDRINEMLSGGQAQFVTPEGRACFPVKRIEAGSVRGRALVHADGPAWFLGLDGEEPRPANRLWAEIEGAALDGDVLTGTQRFGGLLSPGVAKAKVLPVGHPDIWETPAVEPVTIEQLLRLHGEVTPRTVYSDHCIVVTVVDLPGGGSRHLMPPPSYECPVVDVLRVSIDRVTFTDGVFTAEGVLKVEGGGSMARGARAMVGQGATMGAAVANMIRSARASAGARKEQRT